MVTATFIVRHDACSLCRTEDVPLFVLHLCPDEDAHIEPKPEGVHYGVCSACWMRTARVLLHSFDLLAPLFEAQKALEGTRRLLQTIVQPAIDAAIDCTKQGATDAQLKHAIQQVEG